MVLSISLKASAQDWQCVREGITANFADTSAITAQYPTKTLWTVNIDSVIVYQGWMYHYGFKMPRFFSKNYSEPLNIDYCYDPRGPSRMGFAMSARDGENFFFNSIFDGIRISTLRNIDQPWICCRINDSTHLDATVISMNVEPVLGVDDSVKYISFQAKRNTGELITHPLNNRLFKLSKHFGMITLFDFYEFPNYSSNYPVHWLTGIKASGNESGDQNLTAEEIYSYGPGDVFHTYLGGTYAPSAPEERKSVVQILDTLWNAKRDTVTFRMSRYYDYCGGNGSNTHYYHKDTVQTSYALHSEGFDHLSEQSIFSHDTNGVLKYVTSYTQFRGSNNNLVYDYLGSDYNLRWIKVKNRDYEPCSFCADTLVGILYHQGSGIYGNNYYISGCGGPYYIYSSTDYSHKTRTIFYKLVYFKKGDETWGTPLDTTNWKLPNLIPEFKQIDISVYPNPSTGLVIIKIPEVEKADFRLEIFSITGIKINEMKIRESKFAFDISNYSKGMYFLKLYKNNLQLGQQKLMRQ